MHLSELKTLHVSQLLEMAVTNEIEGANRLRKQELIFALLKKHAKRGESIFGDGVLEVLPDGFGFLRSPDTSYLASTDDIYVSPSQIRRFNLHTGDTIEGEIRTPKDGERYFALVKVDRINYEPPEACKSKILFENLTPLHPTEHLKLERDIRAEENTTSRIVDMVLWTPWIDYGKSYRPVAEALSTQLPQNHGCVAARGLGEAQRASLDYFSGIITRRANSGAGKQCRWLITLGQPRDDRSPGEGWQPVWEGNRPGDRSEKLRLYKR